MAASSVRDQRLKRQERKTYIWAEVKHDDDLGDAPPKEHRDDQPVMSMTVFSIFHSKQIIIVFDQLISHARRNRMDPCMCVKHTNKLSHALYIGWTMCLMEPSKWVIFHAMLVGLYVTWHDI